MSAFDFVLLRRSDATRCTRCLFAVGLGPLPKHRIARCGENNWWLIALYLCMLCVEHVKRLCLRVAPFGGDEVLSRDDNHLRKPPLSVTPSHICKRWLSRVFTCVAREDPIQYAWG